MKSVLIRLGLVVGCLGVGALATAGEIVTNVAAGYLHTCAMTSAGRVICWGGNEDGELGDGTTTNRSTPGQVSGLESGVAAIGVGSRHACALTTGGGVLCWGDNEVGQIGDGTTTNRLVPTPVSGLETGVTAIAVGGWHTCALTAAGGVVCWGLNAQGEIGDGTTTDRWTPTPVSGLGSGVAAVTAGNLHTCALTTGGGVACWGYNFDGQLGDGTTLDRYTPVPVTGLAAGVTAVEAGYYHTCAINAAGGALCWGYNEMGQLGDGTSNDAFTPTPVTGLDSGVARISPGWGHTCAVTTSSTVLCWGYNFFGQLGDGLMEEYQYTPKAIDGLGSLVAGVTAGWGHTCAWTTAGGVLSWGLNDYGQLGDGTTTDQWTPVAITTGYEQQPSILAPVDLTGTGISSIVVFREATGQWWINGNWVPTTFGQPGDVPVVADYNGDGHAELAVYRPSTSEWIVQGQSPVVFGQVGDVPVPGDYNGDGKTEMAVFRPSTGDWFIQGQAGSVNWGMRGDIPTPGDYDGDGVTDIAVFRPTTGFWYVMNGPAVQWGMWGDIPVAADYNGDGKTEMAVYRPATGWWYVSGGPMAQWGMDGDVPVPLDVDGDGRTEFVVFRPSTGFWYSLNPTTSATTSVSWGQDGDIPVGQTPKLPATPIPETAGDFDHDGLADVTVFTPSNGTWYTLESTFAYHASTAVTLGQAGDVPVPGDYQGTGRQERAVYRPTTGQWILEDGRILSLGTTGDVPVPADYDGDGITDVAVFTPATAQWSVLTSASGFTTTQTTVWGSPGDKPAQGDYDGDGKADLAVFTPTTGMWTIRSSQTGATLMTVQWGMDGDIPVQADYDGDGKTDIGVFRPSNGYWFGLMSKDGYSTATYQAAQWGGIGDIPVPGDYNGDGKAEVAVYRPSTGTWYVMDVMTIAGWGGATDVPILGRQ